MCVWGIANCISHHALRREESFLDHNSRHAACPGGAARSWFDGRSGGGGWRRWCSSSRSSTVARLSSSLSTSYPCLRRARAVAHPQGCRRGNGRRAGRAGAGRCGVRGRRRGPGSRAEEPSSVFSRPKPASFSRPSPSALARRCPPGDRGSPGSVLAGGRFCRLLSSPVAPLPLCPRGCLRFWGLPTPRR